MDAEARADAVVSSLEIAAEHGGDLTPRVYAALFARAPHLRELFSRDTDGAIKGEMLMKVIEAILDFVGDRRYAHHLVEAEATNHEGYDVPRDLFASFFRIVAEVVRDVCGAEWNATMEAAWRETLAQLDVYVARGTLDHVRATAAR